MSRQCRRIYLRAGSHPHVPPTRMLPTNSRENSSLTEAIQVPLPKRTPADQSRPATVDKPQTRSMSHPAPHQGCHCKNTIQHHNTHVNTEQQVYHPHHPKRPPSTPPVPLSTPTGARPGRTAASDRRPRPSSGDSSQALGTGSMRTRPRRRRHPACTRRPASAWQRIDRDVPSSLVSAVTA
jgi:hypothetical protein